MNNIKKECYSLVQAVVCARDIFCRAPRCSNLVSAAHHLHKRDRIATAFNPKYLIGLCVDCHGWAHAEPGEFREWIIMKIGADEYEYGHQLSLTIAKHVDFEQIRNFLKQELGKYK